MNAALSVIVSIVTVAAGGTAALAGDLLSPDSSHSVPADDCVAGVCLQGGHGNETRDPGNETSESGGNSTAGNGTEPEQPPEEPGHHHHYHNETVHHHHEHNGTHDGAAGNGTAPQEEPEDVHFCTTGFSLLGDGYEFTWDVHAGYESFGLEWHFQSLALGLLVEPDVHVTLLDGAGELVLEAHGDDALEFHLGTEDLRGHAPGTWTFILVTGEYAAEQGLVGHVEY